MTNAVDDAVALPERLAQQVIRTVPDGFAPKIAAGLDVAYASEGDSLVAAAVCVDITSLEIVDSAVVRGVADFPYVPGLFAFRELPSLLKALDRLEVKPDVLVCDGQGIAHPRRFGLASHAGVVTGLPSVGVGRFKTRRSEHPLHCQQSIPRLRTCPSTETDIDTRDFPAAARARTAESVPVDACPSEKSTSVPTDGATVEVIAARPEVWQPPVEPSPAEQVVMKAVRRAKLFVFLREHRHELFDEGFQAELAAMYVDSEKGQPPVPPAQLALATILQANTGVSDDELIEVLVRDRRWQLVLDCLDTERAPFAKGTLVGFRTRLIAADLDRRLIERTVELAAGSKGFGAQGVAGGVRLQPAVGSGPGGGHDQLDGTRPAEGFGCDRGRAGVGAGRGDTGRGRAGGGAGAGRLQREGRVGSGLGRSGHR